MQCQAVKTYGVTFDFHAGSPLAAQLLPAERDGDGDGDGALVRVVCASNDGGFIGVVRDHRGFCAHVLAHSGAV